MRNEDTELKYSLNQSNRESIFSANERNKLLGFVEDHYLTKGPSL